MNVFFDHIYGFLIVLIYKINKAFAVSIGIRISRKDLESSQVYNSLLNLLKDILDSAQTYQDILRIKKFIMIFQERCEKGTLMQIYEMVRSLMDTVDNARRQKEYDKNDLASFESSEEDLKNLEDS